MRTILIWLAAVFVFGNFYAMIAHKEALLRDGQTVYLQLAPVDPRSVMQGDYMALNYAITNQLNHGNGASTSGAVIIQIDAQNVGTFARDDDGKPLAAREHRLKYHRDDWRAVIGAESFFIPEGVGEDFAKAVYGELKLEPDGTPLIVALCDEKRHRLGAKNISTLK